MGCMGQLKCNQPRAESAEVDQALRKGLAESAINTLQRKIPFAYQGSPD